MISVMTQQYAPFKGTIYYQRIPKNIFTHPQTDPCSLRHRALVNQLAWLTRRPRLLSWPFLPSCHVRRARSGA